MQITDLLRAAGLDPERHSLSEEEIQHILEMSSWCDREPQRLIVEVIRAREKIKLTRLSCAKATSAATKLEGMLNNLLNDWHHLARMEAFHETPNGPRVVCRLNGALCELAIHPNVDLELLRRLKSWEYVAVHEHVVVGAWADDPHLLAGAMGDIVDFVEYDDRALHRVRVTQHGHEEKIVMLGPDLWEADLKVPVKLVLQRDDPYRAIRIVPPTSSASKYEVPIDHIHTRLEDLAGVQEIADRLIEDILLRVYFDDIREQFQLEPLRGILLYSRPGMGKTAFIRAIARWLNDHKDKLGVEVVLYVLKPNEAKSMWHGEDARNIREHLWGAIRARQSLPRSCPIVQLVVLDEIDSLGKRSSGEDVVSGAQSDALQAMLVEMDGMIQNECAEGPPAYVLCCGMTNRPDRVDEAAKRPGRFDLVLPMPDVDVESAEDVMAIYARGATLPWYMGNEIHSHIDESQIRAQILRPALAQVFPAVIVRYRTETQRSIDVKAGEVLAHVHYKDAMNRAKKRAAGRCLRDIGTPAIGFDDVVQSLVDVSAELARQLAADPHMLIRQLDIKVPVAGVDVVPKEELEQHRYLQLHTA